MTILAHFTYDESELGNLMGTEGITNLSDLEFFRQECGWLAQSGFWLMDANLLSDNVRDRYIQYVIRWALAQKYNVGMSSPVPYETWVKNNIQRKGE